MGVFIGMPSIGALARQFNVDRDTIKTWSYKFSDYFSPSANPPKGHPRLYNQSDIKILTFIAYWHKFYANNYDESDWDEEIYNALRRDEHLHNEYVLLNTPIFQDVPENITEDWTHGVVVGGFGTYRNRLLIAQSYKKAGDQLFDSVLDNLDDPNNTLQLAYPMFFVYRQAVELYLKIIVPPEFTKKNKEKKIHNLKTLVNKLDRICQVNYDVDLPDWVKERLYEFEEIDPGTSFRYDNPNSEHLHVELWVELRQFRLMIDRLCEIFEEIINLPQKNDTS